MRKALFIKFTALVLILAGSASDSLAQTRIRFERGSDAATLTGVIAAKGSRKFLLRVANGQTVTINVDAGSGRIKIDADDVHGHIGYGTDGSYEYVSDDDGDQSITLINEGRSRTSFAMTVSVR